MAAARPLPLPRLTVPPPRHPAGAAPTAGDSAYAAGFAAGYADGLRRASAEARTAAVARRAREDRDAAARAEATQRATRAVASAAHQLTATADDLVADLAGTVCEAVTDLAEAVAGVELSDPGRRAAAAVRRVLGAAAGSGADPTAPVRVRLHPADAAALDPSAATGVEIVPDPGLTPGDALAGSGTAWIDGRIRQAVARARAAVAG
jgi:flagellar assembly protein FliH